MAVAIDGSAPEERPHAPRVGPMRRLLGRLYFTSAFWYRLHLFGVRVVPERLIPLASRIVGTLSFLALGGVRRATGANLEPVLGPAGWLERQRRAWRTMDAFALQLSERYEQFVPDRAFDCRMVGLEHWHAREEAGTGILLVTAHLSNWEVASTIAADREGRTVHVVREGEMEPAAQAFVAELLARHGGARYVTHFAADDFRLGVELARALAAGDVVALQGDRPRAGGRTVEAELFGRPIELPVGPLTMARVSGVPLLPVFARREGRRRYRVELRPPIGVPRTADRAADLAAGARAFAAELEAAIRAAPHQWFCLGELWPDG